MKSLDIETNDGQQIDQPAELVMDTVAMVTRIVRREMRKHRPVEMSMQQFRALGIVQRHPGASLLTVAGHIGLTTASASKLIDFLVKQGLVARAESAEDRRKLVLNVTEAGLRALDTARAAAHGRLTRILESLSESERSAVLRAMDILRSALADDFETPQD